MTKERPRTTLDKMLELQMDLLYTIQQFKEADEYKTINMNMVSICKELNNLRIKQITDDTN